MEKQYLLNRESITLKKAEKAIVSLKGGISDFENWTFKMELPSSAPIKVNFKFTDEKEALIYEPDMWVMNGESFSITPVESFEGFTYTNVEIGSNTDAIVALTIEPVEVGVFLD